LPWLARHITGACNAGFLVILMTSPFLAASVGFLRYGCDQAFA